MPPKFGTSGLRGLVSELTDDLVADHVRAFLIACPTGGGVHIGQDLRPSSRRIAEIVSDTVRSAGIGVVLHGAVPTPALALAAMQAGAAAIMVTGSHIPADRNGLKFYVPGGEIGKADEGAILAALGSPGQVAHPGPLREDGEARPLYLRRYTGFFAPDALRGLSVGVYEHSSVARDILGQVLRALGAQTVPLARSEVFIPVDTEAVDPGTRDLLCGWAVKHRLDAIASTDGDADRPMLAGADGAIVSGDLLGPLTARFLGADHLVTPVSSNTAVDRMKEFTVTRTRIGSPFVIAAMEAALQHDPDSRVVGYEPNGGFLLGFAATRSGAHLAPLMTRDSLLPILAPLAMMRAAGQSLESLAAGLPRRFTATDRLQGVETVAAAALLDSLIADAALRAEFFEDQPRETAIDLVDGLRVHFDDGSIVHLRPSGNAPEFRCYAEAETPDRAAALLALHLSRLAKVLG